MSRDSEMFAFICVFWSYIETKSRSRLYQSPSPAPVLPPPPPSPPSMAVKKNLTGRQHGGTYSLSPLFPLSFITSGTPQLGTDPQRGTVWFFREQETHHGHKLWASAVCAQPCRFAPAPRPHKVLIQGEGRAQAVAEFTTSRLSITLTAQ